MSAPFLPEPEWVAPVKAPRRTLTIVLWVVLIVMFLTIWQFLTPAERPASAPPYVEPVADCTTAWTASPFMFLPFAIAAGVSFFFVVFFRAYRQAIDFQITQEPGRFALAQRRFDEAIDLFRATLPKFAKRPPYGPMVLLNLAESQLKAGRLDDALASCAQIERSRTLLGGTGVRVRLASLTALLYALKGHDLPLAIHWAGHARSRIAKNREDRLALSAQLVLAEATIAARSGDHQGAVKLLDGRWLELRYALNADTMRTVEVVRAFAEAQAGVRAANVVGERLVRIEPITKGEFAFLGVEWPEMKTFMAAHGLEA